MTSTRLSPEYTSLGWDGFAHLIGEFPIAEQILVAQSNSNGFEVSKDMGKYRHLLYMLTRRDIVIKYKQSIMGFMWAIFMPMLIVSAGMLVRYAFSQLSGVPITMKDIIAVSVKAVPWAFFVASIRFSMVSLISNANLVTKIYFPRALFPIAAVLSQFFDLVVASITLAFILAIVGVGVSVQILWAPVLVSLLFVFVLSFGILLSALALFFRDVKYLVEVALTFGIFFTPVFYEVGMFQEWAPLLLLNPIAPLLEGLHASVVRHAAPAVGWVAYSAVCSMVTLSVSFLIFKRLEPAFAENI
jgi:ABC-type polysaccharide/polyol phosphate export permease